MHNPLITLCKIATKTEHIFSLLSKAGPLTEVTFSTERHASLIMDFKFMMHSQNHFNETKGYQIIS